MSLPTDPRRITRNAPDAIVALDQLVTPFRAAAIRAALALTHRALAVQAPRPRAFVTIEHEREWTDPDRACVTEALELVAQLVVAIDRADATAEAALTAKGRILFERVEAYGRAVSDAADGWDYDAGCVVVGVVGALLEATCLGTLALGQVAWRTAWLVTCPAEDALPKTWAITDGPRIWEERRRLRAVALRDVVHATLAVSGS